MRGCICLQIDRQMTCWIIDRARACAVNIGVVFCFRCFCVCGHICCWWTFSAKVTTLFLRNILSGPDLLLLDLWFCFFVFWAHCCSRIVCAVVAHTVFLREWVCKRRIENRRCKIYIWIDDFYIYKATLTSVASAIFVADVAFVKRSHSYAQGKEHSLKLTREVVVVRQTLSTKRSRDLVTEGLDDFVKVAQLSM